MRKYDSYKDSGIEWIGEIPSHWEVLTLRKKPLNFEVGKREQTELKEVISIGGEHIQEEKFFLDNLKYVSLDFFESSKNGKIEEGDILLVKDGATIGKAMFVDRLPFEKMMLNEHVYKIKANKFFYYIIKSSQTQYQFWMNNQSSAQESITSNTLKSFLFCWPEYKEQTAIAAYLDRKTAEIDELIADKKRLLELYEEEKTAIINQAVTKGINPDVKMKDSGIEWLGEIPEHWEVKRLKTIARVQTGRTPKIQNSQIDFFENGEINWFTPSDFDGNSELTESKRKLNFEAIENGEVELFPENSIYLVSIGATLGKVSFFRDKASANQQINIIIFHPTFNPVFGYYFLVGNKEMITLEADYTTLPILNQSKTKSLSFAVPLFEEQKEIVDFIETETARIDAKKSKTEKLIELLTEYRTALISEVVTGKIKVIE